MARPRAATTLLIALSVAGCSQSHSAVVRTAALPAPPEPAVRHAAPLWVELGNGVQPTQCVKPNAERELCFEDVEQALGQALSRALWTSFPSVNMQGYSDKPAPSDYVLTLNLALTAASPNTSGGPGWAALAKGSWKLTRGGRELAAERVESRSRADFAYGRPLGDGAGEVVDAIAQHVGGALATVPEANPERPIPLPAVSVQPTTRTSVAGKSPSAAPAAADHGPGIVATTK